MRLPEAARNDLHALYCVRRHEKECAHELRALAGIHVHATYAEALRGDTKGRMPENRTGGQHRDSESLEQRGDRPSPQRSGAVYYATVPCTRDAAAHRKRNVVPDNPTSIAWAGSLRRPSVPVTSSSAPAATRCGIGEGSRRPRPAPVGGPAPSAPADSLREGRRSIFAPSASRPAAWH